MAIERNIPELGISEVPRSRSEPLPLIRATWETSPARSEHRCPGCRVTITRVRGRCWRWQPRIRS